MLETIVPKQESDLIMVVLGEHKGQVSSKVLFLHRVAPDLCRCNYRSSPPSRWAGSFSGTRTSAEPSCSWIDTETKCLHTTTTASATMWAEPSTDLHIVETRVNSFKYFRGDPSLYTKLQFKLQTAGLLLFARPDRTGLDWTALRHTC